MLFDSTLRRDLTRSFGATLVVILAVVVTIMLIRTLGLAAGGRVSPQDVLLLLGYVTLGHLATMLALSLFIAVVATLSRMFRDSEMAIWFSSGMSLVRFVRPALWLGVPVMVATALLSFFVWPWQNQRSAELKDRFERRSDVLRVAPGQFQTSSDGRRVFFIERDDANATTGRNVFILSTLKTVEAVTSAHSGRIESDGDDRFIVLGNGQRNQQNLATGEKMLARFESYRQLAGDRVFAGMSNLPARARSSRELLQEATPQARGELAWRAGLVLAAGNLMLLGVGLAAANPRRASNWNLLFALLAFVVYFNVINLSRAWVGSGRLGLGTALLAAHGGAFAVAALLLWRREHRNAGLPWQTGRRRLRSA